MTGNEDHGESHGMRWSWRNVMIVAQISSSYMTDDKDDHADGAGLFPG